MLSRVKAENKAGMGELRHRSSMIDLTHFDIWTLAAMAASCMLIAAYRGTPYNSSQRILWALQRILYSAADFCAICRFK